MRRKFQKFLIEIPNGAERNLINTFSKIYYRLVKQSSLPLRSTWYKNGLYIIGYFSNMVTPFKRLNPFLISYFFNYNWTYLSTTFTFEFSPMIILIEKSTLENTIVSTAVV